MNLARFPRRRYTEGRTPIEKLSRLSAELGGPTIYIKRGPSRSDGLWIFLSFQMVMNGMAEDFSWRHQAESYLTIYRRLMSI